MVDSAFLEWDKAAMLMNLQQLDTATMKAARKADAGIVALNANLALLLALIIIPTLSGVALIV